MNVFSGLIYLAFLFKRWNENDDVFQMGSLGFNLAFFAFTVVTTDPSGRYFPLNKIYSQLHRFMKSYTVSTVPSNPEYDPPCRL